MNENVLKWKDIFIPIALANRINPSLVAAIIDAESGGNENAISSAGALGLMQVMPSHFYDDENGFDPTTNIIAGVSYLFSNYNLFSDWRLAIAAYNAGQQAVINAGFDIPDYEETRHYVSVVKSALLTYLDLDREYMFVESVDSQYAFSTNTYKEAFSNVKGVSDLLQNRIREFSKLNKDVKDNE